MARRRYSWARSVELATAAALLLIGAAADPLKPYFKAQPGNYRTALAKRDRLGYAFNTRIECISANEGRAHNGHQTEADQA